MFIDIALILVGVLIGYSASNILITRDFNNEIEFIEDYLKELTGDLTKILTELKQHNLHVRKYPDGKIEVCKNPRKRVKSKETVKKTKVTKKDGK